MAEGQGQGEDNHARVTSQYSLNKKSPHLTHVGEVVDEDDLLEEAWRRPVQDAVHRPQQDGPSLVVEANHHAGVRQHVTVLEITAPAHTHTHW